MALCFKSIIRLFTKRSRRKKLFALYECKKFELPFYINELALYKFILERQQNTQAEKDYFLEKHTEARCKCLKAIQDLDNLVCDLALENRYEAQAYLKQYQPHSTIKWNSPNRLFYELNNN